MHEEPMQRDPYRRSRYVHSYQERSHRTSCTECDLNDHNAGSYKNCEYRGGDKSGVGHPYQHQNGEEFSSTSGCEQAYHKKVSILLLLLVLYHIQLDADWSLHCYVGPRSDDFNRFSGIISLWGFIQQGLYTMPVISILFR